MQHPDEIALKRIINEIDADDLVAKIMSSLPREVPAHSRMSDETRSGKAYPVIRAVTTTALAALETGVPPTRETLRGMSVSAMKRGAEGTSLEDLLKAYRVGGRIVWRALRHGSQPGDEGALLLAAERIMSFLDIAVANVTSAYLAERLDLVSDQERQARHLIDALDQRADLREGDAELAASYGLAFGGQFIPFALALVGQDATEHANASRQLRSSGHLAVSEGDRIVGLLSVDRVQEFGVDLTDHVVAIGPPTDEGALESAIDLLRVATSVASRIGCRGSVSLGQVAPDLLLELCPEVRSALDASVFGSLSDDLAETLDSFAEHNFDRAATAGSLGLHRNTVAYRLRQIEEMSGRRLDQTRDIAAIALAHLGRRRSSPSGTPPSR